MARRRNGGLIIGMVLGGMVGALVGILLAPEKGEVTREKLRKKGKELAKDLDKKYKRFRKDTLDPAVEDMTKEIERISEKAKSLGQTRKKS